MTGKVAFVLPIVALTSVVAFGGLPDRPEDLSFPLRTVVTGAGTNVVSGAGHEIVLTGEIAGDVTIIADSVCRITLDNVTLAGRLAIEGDAILRACGTSTLDNAGRAVVSTADDLMLAGEGTANLTGGGAKRTNAVIASEDEITVAGGTWNVNMSYTSGEKGFGLAAKKKLKVVAGRVNVVSACTDYKDTALYSDKKNVVIAGGVVRVTQRGPKSVALCANAADASVKLSGGAVILSVGGAGAKGVRCDGAFEMSGGLLDATVSGGPLYEPYEDGEGTNLVVTTTKTSLLSSGTYLLEDVTAAAAVKCGTVKVCGGTVRIVADGVCSRGLVADTTLDLSGGVYDIRANGETSLPVVDLVTDGVLTQVELDRKTAACIRQGDAAGTAAITGGTFYLVATNFGGKCLSAEGALVVGTNVVTTLPTDTVFVPDIQCSTFGQKLFVAAQKLASYTTLGMAVARTDVSSAVRLSQNVSRVRSGSGESVDYTNPKCIKAGGVTFESGRLRMYSKCDGGEGLESKANLTINGGIIEGTCYDDVIQATDTITVNGGYLYCGSTGNDGIDANSAIVINDGVVLAFTLTTPEVGIDVDNSSNLRINGGIVLSVGSASNMAYGSAGTQKSYLSTSASLSTYSGKYLKIANTSCLVKIPTASSSGSCSLMCSAPGCTASAPSASTSASGTDIGFHGVFR